MGNKENFLGNQETFWETGKYIQETGKQFWETGVDSFPEFLVISWLKFHNIVSPTSLRVNIRRKKTENLTILLLNIELYLICIGSGKYNPLPTPRGSCGAIPPFYKISLKTTIRTKSPQDFPPPPGNLFPIS